MLRSTAHNDFCTTVTWRAAVTISKMISTIEGLTDTFVLVPLCIFLWLVSKDYCIFNDWASIFFNHYYQCNELQVFSQPPHAENMIPRLWLQGKSGTRLLHLAAEPGAEVPAGQPKDQEDSHKCPTSSSTQA